MGCAANAHPSAAEDNADVATLEAHALADQASLAAREECKPWSYQACRVYSRDSRGQAHCPGSIAVCRPEGRGWFPCGHYQLDEEGVPHLNDLESMNPDAIPYPDLDAAK